MRYSYFIILFFILAKCNKPENQYENFDFSDYGVFIVNEGNFTYGNSSVSFIDLKNDTIYNQFFYKTNGFPLGDVAQSITLYKDLAFIVINNSGKIYVIDKKNGKYLATIKDLTSPRYIEIINEQKAYITDLYNNNITIFNPETFEITGNIDIATSSETVLKWSNYIFITNWNQGNKVFKINTLTDKIDTIVYVNLQPNSMAIDKNNHIWILSDGGMNPDTTMNDYAALCCFDAYSMNLLKKFEFKDKNASPNHLTINQGLDSLYFLNSSWSNENENGGIYKMSVYDDEIPSNPYIYQGKKLFYSFTIGKKNEILVSDAVDFSSTGKIYIFNQKKELLKTYEAGIIPAFMVTNK